jgi:hypothetical protein
MGQPVLVRSGDAEFYVEVAGPAGGPQTVGLDDVLSFDGVKKALETIGSEVASVWDKIRPAEASVEFGLSLKVRQGKLTGLLVEGGGDASLKVNVVWRRS